MRVPGSSSPHVCSLCRACGPSRWVGCRAGAGRGLDRSRPSGLEQGLCAPPPQRGECGGVSFRPGHLLDGMWPWFRGS